MTLLTLSLVIMHPLPFTSPCLSNIALMPTTFVRCLHCYLVSVNFSAFRDLCALCLGPQKLSRGFHPSSISSVLIGFVNVGTSQHKMGPSVVCCTKHRNVFFDLLHLETCLSVTVNDIHDILECFANVLPYYSLRPTALKDERSLMMSYKRLLKQVCSKRRRRRRSRLTLLTL